MKRNCLFVAAAAALLAAGMGAAQAEKGGPAFVMSSLDGSRTVMPQQINSAERRVGARGTLPTVGLPLAGIETNGEYGDPGNTVIEVNIGANNTVLAVSFDVTVQAFSPSWRSESIVDFTDSALTGGVGLTPGFEDDSSGTGQYSSGGLVDLVGLGLDFQVGADGILRFEFYEGFDDATPDPDALWSDHPAPVGFPGLSFLCSDQAACDAAFAALSGPQSNLGIVKTAPSGVVAGGPFTYQLDASNAGPTDEPNAVVTDVLPAGITFVSSNCGATEAGGTVTWNIGAFANGASASCTLTVNQASTTCSAISNTATISGDNGDSALANNSSTASNEAANPVVDPSFELGTGWDDFSLNFGSVLCDAVGCGTGGGTGPRTGDFWIWFGGISALAEEGYVEQSVTIPAGISTLNFWVEQAVCNAANGAGDFLSLSIDGTEVWRTDATDAACGATGYRQISLPIDAYADDAAHMIRFDSETLGNGSVTNFFIDDVSMTGAAVCSGSPSFNLSSGDVNLGTAPLGTALTGAITITNSGTAAGTVNAPTFTGPFALSGGTCPAAPFILGVGESCTFGIALTATSVGAFTGQISVDAGGATIAANLLATVVIPPPAFIPVSSPWMLGLMFALMGLVAGVVVVRRRG
ncbi:MAG: choice-of-anchor D domain-containing protein [Lysobacteraceae bacterium]